MCGKCESVFKSIGESVFRMMLIQIKSVRRMGVIGVSVYNGGSRCECIQ